MRLATLAAEAEIKQVTPVKTGRLRSSIHSVVEETGEGAVGHISTAVNYAPAVELGAAAHDIAATRAMALMIPIASTGGFGGGRLSGSPRSGQQVAFFRRVHHPGSKGRHFMRDGLESARPAIRSIFSAAAQRVLATVKGV